jgi:hypothetical protein
MAMMVALEVLPRAAVVALKVADVAAAAMLTDDGTVNAGLVLVKVMLTPPAGAGWLNVTVQLLEVFGPMLVGLQSSEESKPGATKLTVVLTELLLYVAVTVALELLPTAVVVATKLAPLAPAGIVTDAGTVSVEFVLVRVTLIPPLGAGAVSVIVHMLEEFGPRLAGLQDSGETSMGATSSTVVLAELLM